MQETCKRSPTFKVQSLIFLLPDMRVAIFDIGGRRHEFRGDGMLSKQGDFGDFLIMCFW